MEDTMVYLIIVFVLALFIGFFFYISIVKTRAIRAKIKGEYGKKPKWTLDERDYNSMKRYFLKAPLDEPYLDDITWNDLNMDALFKRFKNTQSSVGDEYAYRFFRKQQNKNLTHLEEVVTELDTLSEERSQLQFAFYNIGRTTNNTLIDNILDPTNFPKLPYLKIVLTTLLSVGSILLLFFNIDLGALMIPCSLLVTMFMFSFAMKKIGKEMLTLDIFVRLIRAAQLIVKLNIPSLKTETNLLKENLKVFKGVNFLTETLMHASSGKSGGLMVLVSAYFGLYAFCFRFFVSLFTKYRKEVLQLYETIGFIELAISVASYRNTLDYYCHPTFTEDTELVFCEIVHPLLKHPVSNSHTIKNKVLITGSNASGKSTFSKTIAVNVILGQTINTCLAKSFQFQACSVFTSMNLKDDILTGDSFYVAEVKSLKRLLEEADKPPYTMLFLDELFKGTNVVERIASASVILKKLAENNCFICLTTHDMELCHILKNYYTNYHFSETITKDDIFFDYQLQEGMSTGSNAIKLLAYCDYPSSIVKEAEAFAGEFKKTGQWNTI